MDKPTVIIACSVLQPELDALKPDGVQIVYLPQGLHRTPKLMPARIQEALDQVADQAGRVVLGYGLCSNGVVGVKAPATGLYVPLTHDCIPILMGSVEAHRAHADAHPGTYYLTPGWVAEKRDPVGCMEDDYVPRLGREVAERVLKLEYQNYTHIALIDTGVGDREALRQRAMENANHLEKKYLELQGSQEYFQALLHGPWDQERFVYFAPGEAVHTVPWLGF